MKTKYKYIYFSSEGGCKTNGKLSYACRNNKSDTVLAYIYWNKEWKQWIFTQADSDVIFSVSCLIDIVDYMKQLD